MPEPIRHSFAAGPSGRSVKLALYQMKNTAGSPPVLMLHGASANHETFLLPRTRSLAEYLHGKGYEPWLLDWRGSSQVTDEARQKLHDSPKSFDFDHAADHDIPTALTVIDKERFDGSRTSSEKIGAVGHCMGAGILAQAIASGAVEGIV